MDGQLTVEEVFDVSFVEGVMVVGLYTGRIARGDIARVDRVDGAVDGAIGVFHIHLNADDPPERVRVEVHGPLADVVKIGDVIHTTRHPDFTESSET